LLEGLADLPQRSEELRDDLRASSAEHGAGHLHRILARLDPQAAKKIALADEQKLIRAIEICLLAGKPLTEVHRAGRTPLAGWSVLKIGLDPPREALYQRIHERIESMLLAGWLDEVRRLVAGGLPEDAKPLDFIGYRELRAHLRGELTLAHARAAIQQGTRQYAKRQLTWFRRESGVHWLHGLGDDAQIQSACCDLLAQHFSAG
jgi:tRNA dimethylallyltransferase